MDLWKIHTGVWIKKRDGVAVMKLFSTVARRGSGPLFIRLSADNSPIISLPLSQLKQSIPAASASPQRAALPTTTGSAALIEPRLDRILEHLLKPIP
jgi:hypothetical protein